MDPDLVSLTNVHLALQLPSGPGPFSATSTLHYLIMCPVESVMFHAKNLQIKGMKAQQNKQPVEVCVCVCVFGVCVCVRVCVCVCMAWYGMAWYGMVWYGMLLLLLL